MSTSTGTWPRHLEPGDLDSLRFCDFPGATIEDVARYLYRMEPRFMQALETDARKRGITEPVKLGDQNTITDGQHRLAVGYRAGVPVPVALDGEVFPVNRAQQARWDEIRRSNLTEYGNRVRHIPERWPAELAEAERAAAELEAG